MSLTMEKLVALCKVRGIFSRARDLRRPGQHLDYGPLGVEFKNNIKRAWWKKFVQESEHNGPGQRHFDEPGRLARLRPCGQLQ